MKPKHLQVGTFLRLGGGGSPIHLYSVHEVDTTHVLLEVICSPICGRPRPRPLELRSIDNVLTYFKRVK